MSKVYGVGIIGLQAGRSWAHLAHIPAINAQPEDFRFVGVANTSEESAQRAIAEVGQGRAFASTQALIADPAVDIVAICVKVPYHAELVRSVLEAGKHVYCEWPLGNGLAEARELATLATAKGVLAIAGTQARRSPGFQHLTALVKSGYLGDVLSVSLLASGMNWGEMVDQVNAYTADISTGASMLTIPFGHTMAALADVVGEVATVSALLKVMRPTVTLVESGEKIARTAHDQVMVIGELASGVPISIHYRGGMPRGPGLLLEILGTEGELQATAMGGHGQFVELEIRGAKGDGAEFEVLPVPGNLAPALGLDLYSQNVGEMYRSFAADLRTGTRLAPTFDDAVRTHQLIAAIEESDRLGRRVTVSEV